MYHSKFYRSFIAVNIVFVLLAGCNGSTTNAPPTATVGIPTLASPVVKEPTATPELTAEIGAPGLGDSLYPDFGNGGYDVQHYTLDLTVNDVAATKLDGVTTIDARATQNLSSFNLDFYGFEVTSIKVNGQPAEFKRLQQELTIIPSAALLEDQSFTVEVQYHGSPYQMISVAIPIRIGWVGYSGGSYVLSEPDGATNFFPVNDHPLDKATYTFHITVPEPFEVAANGVLTETTDHGSTTSFTFEMRDLMASYLATVDIGEFDLENSQAENGIPIRNYFASALPEEIRKPFALQDEMLVYYSDIFGPYPFEVYGALVLDTQIGGALENQTMSVFGITGSNQEKGLEGVIAHELVHQWFGDSVSLADWQDIWLNESFATYAQGLWIEHTEGREALDDWVKEMYTFVRENRERMSPPGSPPAHDLFNAGVYLWGALGLHALRLEVGDEKFFEILQTYYSRYKGGNATTADFIAVAEEVSGQELSAFFDSWLYSSDLAPIPALDLGTK